MLGGCSSGNAMMFHLGSPKDYDAWARAQKEDGSGWAYQAFQRCAQALVESPSDV